MEKERERIWKVQQQRRLLYVSSLPAYFWEPEEEHGKKEQQWRGNFGTPAHLKPTHAFKPEPRGGDSGVIMGSETEEGGKRSPARRRFAKHA